MPPPPEAETELSQGTMPAQKRHRTERECSEDGAKTQVDGITMDRLSEYGVLHSKYFDNVSSLAEGIIEVSAPAIGVSSICE